MAKRRVMTLSIVTVCVAVAIGATGVVAFRAGRTNGQTNKYSLLDPSVSTPGIHQEIVNFDPLRQNLKTYLASLNLSHSLYFEYLPNGINIRDGADDTTVAASLMKTPIVMDLYKLAENKKISLDAIATIQSSEISSDLDYGDPSGLQVGQTISLRNAAKIALNQSDNTAIAIVKDSISNLVTKDTDAIQSLDITYSVSNQDSNTKEVLINARSYSSILKCLYYSCFINPADSQEILGYLIDSAGADHLASGIPSNIKIAHKVGSATVTQSDCGIIYQPNKPYLVCLMFFNYNSTNGKEVNSYFKHVSQMIHDYVVKSGSNN